MNLHKLQDIVIYRDDEWYSTFPSVIRLGDGQLICGFRRAPERRLEPGGGGLASDGGCDSSPLSGLQAAAGSGGHCRQRGRAH